MLFIHKYNIQIIETLLVHSAAYIGALSKHRLLLTDLSSIDNNASNDDNDDLMFYLSVYGGLAGANSLLTLIRAFLFAYGGIEAAVILHSQLLAAILKVKSWSLCLTNSVTLLNGIMLRLYLCCGNSYRGLKKIIIIIIINRFV